MLNNYIINIDTAVQTASICLAREGSVIAVATNPRQQDHAAWLHVTLAAMMKKQGVDLKELDAIAISEGPGSYTGLRVGMSAAKGLSYALQKPLIAINTLEMMAAAAMGAGTGDTEFLCPMIDARRMEVFTAVFDGELKMVRTPANMILDEHSFEDLLAGHKMRFFGNGSNKFETLVRSPNAEFAVIEATAADMAVLSYKKFKRADFAPLAYLEPFYGKDFHSPAQ
jgi:tRNA threonylcarbamoyladenosine biosynthesis protein TsaB